MREIRDNDTSIQLLKSELLLLHSDTFPVHLPIATALSHSIRMHCSKPIKSAMERHTTL